MFLQGRFEMILLIFVVLGVCMPLVSCGNDFNTEKGDPKDHVEGQCSGTGQFCGSLKLSYPPFPSLFFEAKVTQLCCGGLLCDDTVSTDKQNHKAGLCYPKDGKKVECVGHNLPCAEMKEIFKEKVGCCENEVLKHEFDKQDLKCSEAVDAFGIKAGFCLTGNDTDKCLAAGFPCGQINVPSWGKGELKCCDGLKCDEIFDAQGYAKVGFCQGKTGGHRANPTAGGDETTIAVPGSSDIPKSSIGQLALAIFTSILVTSVLYK